MRIQAKIHLWKVINIVCGISFVTLLVRSYTPTSARRYPNPHSHWNANETQECKMSEVQLYEENSHIKAEPRCSGDGIEYRNSTISQERFQIRWDNWNWNFITNGNSKQTNCQVMWCQNSNMLLTKIQFIQMKCI